MKIIIGLGNPGKKYQNTRHNVGWLVLEALADKIPPQGGVVLWTKNNNVKFLLKKKLKAEIFEIRINDKKVILAKPQTFMNNSGQAVKKTINNYQLAINNLIVIHDDLDIPLGKYKIQLAKGPKEHGGVESVEKALKTKDFWRIRVGIENRKKEWLNGHMAKWLKEDKRVSGEEYVLQEFTKEERKVIDQVILEMIEEIKNRLNLF